MLCFRKPRSSRVKRVFEKRAPQVVENVKKAVFVRTTTSNEVVNTLLKDLVCTARRTGRG